MGYSLCVIGCGTMGIAILSGVIDNISSPFPPNGSRSNDGDDSLASTPNGSLIIDSSTVPARFICTVNRPESQRRLRRVWNEKGGLANQVEVRLKSENVKSVKEADVVLLCCKPQMAAGVLTEAGMEDALQNKLVISILAGVTIQAMKQWVPDSCTVVRSMPNTPTKIREGMTVVSSLEPGPSAAQHKEMLVNLFTPLGKCRFLEEKHFDAVTAVCGSGPAFVCLVLEAMADGGVMMGLPRSEALELAAQTMQGAARMVMQTGAHPAAIKDSVTTPGGCTIAGLLALEDGRVRSTISRCIQATALHAAGLGKPGPTK